MRLKMSHTLLPLAILCVAFVGIADAQTTTVPVESVTKPPKAAAAPPAAGQLANVRIDVTITDQTGPGEPMKKVVTMLLADNVNGSIRTRGNVRNQGMVQINVDARANILPGGHLRVSLGLEYNPRAAASDAVEASSLNEQLAVVVENGKPLVVSQAADPASDRKISVELKATILK